MDTRKLNKLVELMEKGDLSEIEIRETLGEGEEYVRISRKMNEMCSNVMMAPAAPVAATAAPSLAETASNNNHEPEVGISGHPINSPMVGTVYLAPTPGAEKFVEVGQRVSVGSVLCIVEAMKMFNQIESDKEGVIKARLIDDGQPVEFGEPLFIIEEERN
jgi:acetyl-CoA carboxylase biotin carboxyl carrier protein